MQEHRKVPFAWWVKEHQLLMLSITLGNQLSCCLAQVCSRESEDQDVLSRHGHVDVRRDPVGDVHPRPGALAGPQREPGKQQLWPRALEPVTAP